MNSDKRDLPVACPLPSGRDRPARTIHPTREFIEDLRTQWKSLWKERYDDKVKAEGIASRNYPSLLVERGTVIIATRNFKFLDFQEILKFYGFNSQEIQRFFPNPHTGGWGKFIKETIRKQTTRQRISAEKAGKQARNSKKLPAKKGGRGWIHSY